MTPRLAGLVCVILLASAGALPRFADLDAVVTVDETRWLDRSQRFADAVTSGRFADTIETGHPGVTAMWLAGFAQRTLPADAELRQRYARARLGLAVADVALILLIFALARSLLGATAALLGGLFLALDPFLIANNRVVHLDGLLALLMLASFLALMRGLPERDVRLLTVSGVLAGLALLTKVTAAFLVVAFLLLVLRRVPSSRRRVLGAWLAPLVITGVVLWPAMWVVPWRAVAEVAVGAGGAGHEIPSGRLLVGGPAQPILFYPAVFIWRSTPATLVGVAAAAWWAIRRRRGDGRSIAALLAYAAAFLAFVTVVPKHIDRYLLPALLAADVAAAAALARWIGTHRERRGAVAFGVLTTLAVLGLHAAPGLASHPYQVAAYNPAVGGSITAERVMVLGLTGEGLDRAAEDLSQMPRSQETAIAVTHVLPFRDFFRGRTVPLSESALARPDGRPVDLVLFYLPSIQTDTYPELWDRYRSRQPIYTLMIAGLPYVRVYRVTETTETP